MTKMMSALIISLLALQVQAAKVEKDKDPALDESVTQISVPVLSTAVNQQNVGEALIPEQPDFAFSYSSYIPTNFSRPSFASGADDFNSASVPQLSLDRYSTFRDLGSRVISYDLGVSYAQMQRTGTIALSPAAVSSVSEQMNIASLKLGAEYRWKGTFQPAVSAALLPTWLISPESSIEPNGLSTGGLLGLVSAQIGYSPKWMKTSSNSGAGVGIAADYTLGYIAGSDLSGFGLRGFARINY